MYHGTLDEDHGDPIKEYEVSFLPMLNVILERNQL